MKPIEKQKANLEKLFHLFQLIRENPELPIVPMVEAEIVCDDCGRWMASWGDAEIDKYIFMDEMMYLHSCRDLELVKYFNPEWNKLSYGQLIKAYENLPWIEAIIVNIDIPEQ